jgi:hypothetical protein
MDTTEVEMLDAVRQARAEVDAAKVRYREAIEAAMAARRVNGEMKAPDIARAAGFSIARLYQFLKSAKEDAA